MTNQPINPICSTLAYSLVDLKRLGIGSAALRQARRNGLPVSKIGVRKFVRGAALLKYLERIETTDS